MKRGFQMAAGLLLIFSGIWFVLIPALVSCWYVVTDEGLKGEGPSAFAIRVHRRLSEDYPDYVRERIASGDATRLTKRQIAETEWPLFGACFYLWATEELQAQWQMYPDRFSGEPRVYAREAVEAAKDLVTDPGHATWVRQHWGEDYLEQENCFYRMLLISAMTSHARLTGETENHQRIGQLANSLAAAIASSAHGWIDDYPEECYPSDVVAAVAAIKEADDLLGVERGAFYEECLRGFTGENCAELGLPPFAGDSDSGNPFDPSRGSSNAHLLTFAPRIWPEASDGWYQLSEQHFWTEGVWLAGFREYAKGYEDPGYDVDAGPVLFDLGSSACAFGVGAARSNGRFDHARTLSTEMIVASWPLAGGRLMAPRWLSSSLSNGQAPLLGESAIAFQLSREPADGERIVHHGSFVPGIVWLVVLMQSVIAALLLWAGWLLLRKPFRK